MLHLSRKLCQPSVGLLMRQRGPRIHRFSTWALISTCMSVSPRLIKKSQGRAPPQTHYTRISGWGLGIGIYDSPLWGSVSVGCHVVLVVMQGGSAWTVICTPLLSNNLSSNKFYIIHISCFMLNLVSLPTNSCMCVPSCFSHVWLFAILWTVACQAPLSTGFSRQEYWSGLPRLPPGDLSDLWIQLTSLMSPALAGQFFTTRAIWEAPTNSYEVLIPRFSEYNLIER